MSLRASQVLHLKPKHVPTPEESYRKQVVRDIRLGLLRDGEGRRMVLLDHAEAERRLKERGFEG